MLSFFQDEKLKCILTIEELESKDWLKELGLADNQAAEDEYKRLLAMCIGSLYVAFNCQIVDFEKEHKDTNTKGTQKQARNSISPNILQCMAICCKFNF